MKRAAFKPRTKPMARGTATMKTKTARVAKRRPKTGDAELCRGQGCYLRIENVCIGGTETTVPCHSNAARHGKGMGIKAHDEFTVPGCHACHAVLDQGQKYTKAEKFGLWDAAYARWVPDRDKIKRGA